MSNVVTVRQTRSGIGFLGLLVLLLTGLFVAGKIFGFITWSWLMVFLPLLIYFAIPFIFIAMALGFVFILLGAALMLAVVAGIGFVAYTAIAMVISKIRERLKERAK